MKHLILVFTLVFVSFGINAQQFEVRFSSKVLNEPFSGNVLLYLSKENKTPKNAFVALELIPVYRTTVENIKPNEFIVFDDNAISYPVELSNIERGDYYVQAVFDRNLGGQNIGQSPGNIYSEPFRNYSK